MLDVLADLFTAVRLFKVQKQVFHVVVIASNGLLTVFAHLVLSLLQLHDVMLGEYLAPFLLFAQTAFKADDHQQGQKAAGADHRRNGERDLAAVDGEPDGDLGHEQVRHYRQKTHPQAVAVRAGCFGQHTLEEGEERQRDGKQQGEEQKPDCQR